MPRAAQSSKSSGEPRKNWAPLMELPPPIAFPLGTGVGSVCWRVGLPSNDQLCGASTAEANGLLLYFKSLGRSEN